MSRSDQHRAAREALVRRLDEPLAPADETALQAHLAACGPCASVAKSFEMQRKLLRELHVPDPPRDLWARTATALDHEVGRRRGAPRLVALGSVASLGLVLVVALGTVGLGPFSVVRPGNATPFPVTPQPVAYLTTDGNQITIYQTQVSSMCPESALDCVDPGPSARPVARGLRDAALSPRDLALAADGNLAITARDSLGRAIYSVVALPGSEATASVPTTTPALTGRPSASGTHVVTTPIPSAPATGSTGPIVSPTAAGLADATLQPLLSDVIAAGAPAAWSPDGTILAFSARPADGSTGPDVYIWQVGASAVKALTKDHHSYFASWDGQRIVISRLPAAAAHQATTHPTGGAGHTPAPTAKATAATATAPLAPATLLLDPATGAAQPVALADAWLPAVDPTGHLVVYWSGTLTMDGAAVDLSGGALYLADWAALTGLPPVATPAASPTATGEASPSTSDVPPSAGASASPSGSAGDAGPTPPLTGATATPRRPAPSGPAASASPTPTVAGASPGASAGPATADTAGPFAVSQTGSDVADWLVRWAADGSVYGIWTADAPGSDVGTLTVIMAAVPEGQDLLGSTPAQRAFSLSAGRVAWVTPDTALETGDLRIVTWGADGSGGVHIPIRHGVTLAF
ncbi:MAG TPA: zf-HC2 domain-containing protein [Candidatus Sulfotelmatobacter sp.]|nr:zf-HC2 domain-containing protein [Candidatus Sulfotelmatobacter sp.]